MSKEIKDIRDEIKAGMIVRVHQKVKETNAWYQSFIKKVLDEIMRDPLRERKSYDDLEKIKLELEANNIWKMNIEASKNNQ